MPVQFDINTLFQGGAVLALMTYLVMLMKDVPTWIWSRIERKIIYKVNINESDELYNYFEKWLIDKHGEKYRNVEASLDFIKSPDESIVPDKVISKNIKYIKYKQYEDFFTIKYLGKKLYINKGRVKFENASDIKNAFYNNFRINGFFAKNETESLLNHILEYNLKLEFENRKINIYTNDKWGNWDMVHDLKAKNINDIIIDENDKRKLINDVSEFENSEIWYNKRSVSYKRGYLFHGAPGNGKSSLILSLALLLKRDVYFLNGDISDNNSLNNAMRKLKPNSLLAFEDVDCLFKERTDNKLVESQGISNNKESTFNFSTLLNCLDGVFSKENIITIMTTNYIEKLDPALIREGRVDMKLEIKNPNDKLIKEYLELFYDRLVQLDINIDSNIHLSMAAVQDICIRNRNNFDEAIEEIKKKLKC